MNINNKYRDQITKTLYDMNIYYNYSNNTIKEIIEDTLQIVESLQNKKIPDKYPEIILKSFAIRSIIIELQGFCIVDKQWTKKLSAWIGNRKCLEIMAGKGTISKALQDNGVNIIATDDYSWKGSFNFDNLFTDVEKIDCLSAIEKYKDRDIIIMSWAYMDDTSYWVVQKLKTINPNAILISIGEGYGGCTDSCEFFDLIEDHENLFDFNIPSWNDIHDYLKYVNISDIII